ncbi:unnamed protein product [Caenorhabditis sp. 36 PRJEB53466]|nr:unnamed protein product [Caenorhabditis sp. 36 PRJEB53466]
MNIEHTNFIRNSRKFLHCGECGRPFDTDSLKPRVLPCGHNVCEQCMGSQRLSTGPKFCMVCDSMRKQSDRSAPVSHDLLGIVYGKEQAMKRVPLKYRCRECNILYRENDMTVCRTCSGWSEGMQTEEATDFAKRPISALMCQICAKTSRHAAHDKMSIDIINRIWDTPIATEYIETQLGTAEKLLDVLRGGAITQINQLADSFSETLEVFKLKISNGQFPLDSTVHITKAVDVISRQIRKWNLGIQKSSEDALLLLDYFETLVKHVIDTPRKSGTGKWEPPGRPTAEIDPNEELSVVIGKNIRELRTAMPIGEHKLSPSPVGDDERVAERSSETTNESELTPSRKRTIHSQFYIPDEYERPRRGNTKKNYAVDDDNEVEPEVVVKKRGRRKAEPSTSDMIENGMNGMSVRMGAELVPYNMAGTHLANDALLSQGISVSPVRRAGRRGGRGGRRRGGFRGGRGSRGGYRHLAINLNTQPDSDPEDHVIAHNPHEGLFNPDVDPLHDPMGGSFDTIGSDEGNLTQEQAALERTTDQLFEELTGIGSINTSGAVSSCGTSGGGGQPGEGQGPSPPPLSQNSSPPPPSVGQPSKVIMPLDFLGQANGSRDLRSPYGDGYVKKQRPWDEVTQEARYGNGVAVPDYYHHPCTTAFPPPTMPIQSFINNTPPY